MGIGVGILIGTAGLIIILVCIGVAPARNRRNEAKDEDVVPVEETEDPEEELQRTIAATEGAVDRLPGAQEAKHRFARTTTGLPASVIGEYLPDLLKVTVGIELARQDLAHLMADPATSPEGANRDCRQCRAARRQYARVATSAQVAWTNWFELGERIKTDKTKFSREKLEERLAAAAVRITEYNQALDKCALRFNVGMYRPLIDTLNWRLEGIQKARSESQSLEWYTDLVLLETRIKSVGVDLEKLEADERRLKNARQEIFARFSAVRRQLTMCPVPRANGPWEELIKLENGLEAFFAGQLGNEGEREDLIAALDVMLARIDETGNPESSRNTHSTGSSPLQLVAASARATVNTVPVSSFGAGVRY